MKKEAVEGKVLTRKTLPRCSRLALSLLTAFAVGSADAATLPAKYYETIARYFRALILDPADFESAEYATSDVLRGINASTAYSSNLRSAVSGAGVVVAVIDTGVDTTHREFAGRVVPGGRMFGIAGDPNAVTDLTGHGTHVAGIIGAARDGQGSHGVAWGAWILPIGIGPNSMSDSDYAAIFRLASSKGARVLNNSWISNLNFDSVTSKAQLSRYMPETEQALRGVVAANGVVVFAAGNDSRTSPQFWARLPEHFNELRDNWLAVVAVDSTGALASYSNACGTTMTQQWCLAAPGGDTSAPVYSTAPGGTYTEMMGTSMATPVVSGSLAVLMQKFPTLTAAQIVDRVLHTANRTGIYAQAHLYGQGLLDLGAAASPVDGLFVPTSASVNGAVTPLTSFGIAAPAGQAVRLRDALRGQAILAVDGYQRAPFQLEADSLVFEGQKQGERLEHKLQRRAARVAVADAASGLVGYQQLDGTEMLVSAAFSNDGRLAFASDTTFAALTRVFSPLQLTPSAAQEQLAGRDGLDLAAESTVGLGFSRTLSYGWAAAMTTFAGQNEGGQRGVSAHLTRSWTASAATFDVTQHSQNTSKASVFGNGLAMGGAQHQAARTVVSGTFAWQPTAQWELFSQAGVTFEEAKSRANDLAVRRDTARAQMTFGASHALANSGLTLSALYRVEPAARTAMSLTLPNWVQDDGTVTSKTAKLGYNETAVHRAALHLEGTVGRNARDRVSLGLSRSSQAQTEAMATWSRMF